jgi:hypothetical protein
LISRTAAFALCVTVTLGAAAVPCAADDTAATKADGKLTRLSPASRQVLSSSLASPKPHSGEGANPGSGEGGLRRSDGGQTASPGTPSSFFGSTRGKVTLVLMAAGTGLTLWSIQHDRKPVKSPIR